jgi:hypothetical protein
LYKKGQIIYYVDNYGEKRFAVITAVGTNLIMGSFSNSKMDAIRKYKKYKRASTGNINILNSTIHIIGNIKCKHGRSIKI